MTAASSGSQAGGSIFGWSPPGNIRWHHLLLVSILLLAAFSRLWRLGEPERCYFDEVYFPTTGAEILRGDNEAWSFFGHENTHPPLSKVLMAAGMGIFGHKEYDGRTNECWGDDEDALRRGNPAWLYDPFGWRFPGAVAGIAAVVFMYLLAKRLFNSEVAGLAGAFLLTVDGLAFTHARIGTPDTYVLCFMLGSLYFLVSKRWLLSGVFLGAAAASKWSGAFAVLPIVLYFAWTAFVRWREAGYDRRLREAERVLASGAGAGVIGIVLFAVVYVLGGGLSAAAVVIGGLPLALGAFVIGGGLLAIVTDRDLRNIPRAQVYVQTAVSLPLFFIAVPFAVYMATYTPMFFNGHGLGHWWELNDAAYLFHENLESTHPYQSDFLTWPITMRPVYFFLGPGHARIYNLGNPIVFWMSLPALAFALWQGVKYVRIGVDSASRLNIWGRLGNEQAMLIWMVLSYLGSWLALSTQGRALFLYHYVPALIFAILALAYVVHWLWQRPEDRSRYIAAAFLAAAGATAVYFYPHWAAVDVPGWLDSSYYWFDSWR